MLSREDNEFLTRSGPGTPMGDLLRRFWMPALLERGAARARRAAQEDQDPGRGPAGLPRHRRPRRHRRAALPASRRQPLFRPQRGVRPALRLPRLEVRRRRQLRRPADLAAGIVLQGHDQAARLSDARMGRHGLGLHGPARAHAGAAAARAGPGAGGAAATSPRSGRTATGCRASRARSTPRISPSCTRCRRKDEKTKLEIFRSTSAIGAGQELRRSHPLGDGRSHGRIRDRGPRHRAGDRRGAQDRLGRQVLAHLPVPDAQPCAGAGRFPGRRLSRPVLGAGRRRQLLDLHLQLAARPAFTNSEREKYARGSACTPRSTTTTCPCATSATTTCSTARSRRRRASPASWA